MVASRPPLVRMSFLQNASFKMIKTPAWEIKHTTRWSWIQRACEWALLKTGALCQHFDREPVVHEITIDTAKAAEEIVRIAYDQIRRAGAQPECVLLGRPQFESIVGSSADLVRQPFSFDVQLSVSTTGGSYRTGNTGITFLNLPVRVIPWMDGVLVL